MYYKVTIYFEDTFDISELYFKANDVSLITDYVDRIIDKQAEKYRIDKYIIEQIIISNLNTITS